MYGLHTCTTESNHVVPKTECATLFRRVHVHVYIYIVHVKHGNTACYMYMYMYLHIVEFLETLKLVVKNAVGHP